MKLDVLHDGSLKPRPPSSLAKPMPTKPDIVPLKYQVPQLRPVGEEDAEQALQANSMANSLKGSDVSNLDAPTPLYPRTGQ